VHNLKNDKVEDNKIVKRRQLSNSNFKLKLQLEEKNKKRQPPKKQKQKQFARSELVGKNITQYFTLLNSVRLLTLVVLWAKHMVKLELLFQRIRANDLELIIHSWVILNDGITAISNFILVYWSTSAEDPDVPFKLNHFIVKPLPLGAFLDVLFL